MRGLESQRSRRGPNALAVALLLLLLAAGAPAGAGDFGATAEQPLQALRLRGLTARPAALLMSGQSGGEVPLAVLPLPLPSTTGGGVAVIVEAGLEALAGAEAGDLRSEIYVYATDAAGAPRDALTQTFTVTEAALTEASEGGSAASAVRFLGHLELPPGSYDLRVLMIGRTPERFGLHRAELQVPDLAGDAPVLWPPLLSSGAQKGWLFVREAPHGRERRDPLELLGLETWPSARPVLDPEWEGEVRVLGRRMGPLPGDLAGVLSDAGESPLGRSPLISATLGPPGGGLESWRLKVRLEPAGSGVALWQWETSVDGVALPPAREVWLAEASGASGRPWTALVGSVTAPAASLPRASAGASREAPREAPGKLEAKELRTFSRKYSQALAKLAAGKRSRSLAEVIKLEGDLIAGRSLAGVEALKEVEMGILRKVAATSPEALVPVIWLYLDVFERSLKERRLLLAVHARVLAVDLVDVYLESATGERAKALAADLLTAVGGSLQASSLSTASEAAFRRAVELDSGQVEALRGLVASYERARQDDLAILHLEKLTALRPGDTEACVRLGRIHLRNDRKPQAEATFRTCVAKKAPEWALAVAYQELALLLGRSQRWEEAAQRLEEGHRRMPRQPRIQLLRAYALDRLQRPAAGRHAVAELQGSGSAIRDSPRARYGRWPRELFALFRRRLEPEVDRRLEVLAEALGEVPS